MGKKTCYFFYPNDGGCNYHRVLQPARFCHQRYDKDWHFEVGPGPARDKEVYYFSGLPDVKNAQATLLEIQYLKRSGSTFVWGVDDDWLSIPSWNPAKPDEASLCTYDIMKQIADWIIVSTSHIKDTFKDVKHKVLVAPNLLDLTMYPHVNSEIFTDGDGRSGKRYDIEVQSPVRIIWSGSETHKGDLDEITEPLDEFIGKYCGIENGNKAIVIFSGMMPHGKLVRKYLHKGMFFQPPVLFASYHAIVGSLKPHIYLAPLANIDFNKGKSNLRILEGWAMCAPPIASNIGEYSSTVGDYKNGMLSMSFRSWYNSLVELTTNHELRVNLASRGRMKVETEYNWEVESCRKEWYAAFDKILGY